LRLVAIRQRGPHQRESGIAQEQQAELVRFRAAVAIAKKGELASEAIAGASFVRNRGQIAPTDTVNWSTALHLERVDVRRHSSIRRAHSDVGKPRSLRSLS